MYQLCEKITNFARRQKYIDYDYTYQDKKLSVLL